MSAYFLDKIERPARTPINVLSIPEQVFISKKILTGDDFSNFLVTNSFKFGLFRNDPLPLIQT